MEMLFTIVGTIIFLTASWFIYQFDKKGESKKLSFNLILIGMWVGIVGIYLKGNSEVRDMLVPVNFLQALLIIWFSTDEKQSKQVK